jgi:uncharacterized protein (TIGR02246 family)
VCHASQSSLQVADRYTKDAVLLPTLSNTPRNTRAEIVAYFVSFLQNKPVGVFQTIAGGSPNVKNLAPGVVSLSGVAKFTLTGTDGAKSDVFVRKTFVFQKVGADWLIAEHQSSLMPESEAQPTAEQVVGFFNTWNAALQTLDPKKVRALMRAYCDVNYRSCRRKYQCGCHAMQWM